MFILTFNKFNIFIFLIAVSIFTLIFAGINVLIDPYSFYGSSNNMKKTDIGNHEATVKAIRLRQIKPKALILGTSRADFGIDPAHSIWLNRNIKCYNAALSGGPVLVAKKMFQIAASTGELKEVVIGLDDLMFSVSKENLYAFDDELLDEKLIVDRHIAMVFSITQLESALKTLLRHIKKTSGFGSTYGDKNGLQYFNYNGNAIWSDGTFDKPNSQHDFTSQFIYNDGSETFKHLEYILNEAHKMNINVRMFFSPIHYELFKHQSSGNYEHFKNKVIDINYQAAKNNSAKPFEIWDFSGRNSYTTEKLPAKGDSAYAMQWYWEFSHYKKELGDIILSIMYRESTYGDFGNRIAYDETD